MQSAVESTSARAQDPSLPQCIGVFHTSLSPSLNMCNHIHFTFDLPFSVILQSTHGHPQKGSGKHSIGSFLHELPLLCSEQFSRSLSLAHLGREILTLHKMHVRIYRLREQLQFQPTVRRDRGPLKVTRNSARIAVGFTNLQGYTSGASVGGGGGCRTGDASHLSAACACAMYKERFILWRLLTR